MCSAKKNNILYFGLGFSLSLSLSLSNVECSFKTAHD